MEFVLNLTAERSVVRESLKGIIWSIFFHRLFGPINPTTNEFLNITYPMADLPDLDSLIDERINRLIKKRFDNSTIEKQDDYTMGSVVVEFLDKRVTKPKKKTGWFGQGKSSETEDLKLWECWIINVKCLSISKTESPKQRLGNSMGLTQEKEVPNHNISTSIDSFENNLRKVIDIADNHKDHIPPITSLESSPFPYTIDVDRKVSSDMNYSTGEDDSWGGYIKKMLD